VLPQNCRESVKLLQAAPHPRALCHPFGRLGHDPAGWPAPPAVSHPQDSVL